MRVQTTTIPGLWRITLETNVDERGSFQETWHTEKWASSGLPRFEPKQWNTAISRRGVLRGIHAEPWEKYVYVPQETVFAVIVDLRQDQSTFGTYASFELDSTQALFLSRGLGNSYQALSDEVVYSYLTNGIWQAEEAPYPAIAYNDPDLAIPWPILGKELLVSEKDKRNPTLQEFMKQKTASTN